MKTDIYYHPFDNKNKCDLTPYPIPLSKTLEKFKINTQFVIVSEPTQWASLLNDNCPLEINLKFPYHSKIINRKLDGDYIAMDDGTYGWSLSTLVKENKIYLNQEYRKLKLINLKNKL